MKANKKEKSLIIDRCPHCGIAHPNLELESSFKTTDFSKIDETIWWIYICHTCGGVITVSTHPFDHNYIDKIYPFPKILDPVIPEKALSFLQQAMETLNAPAASIMVSASAIDEMLKERGLKEGKLYSRINKAVENHLITEDMAKWAHEVRLEANDQRHADEKAQLPKKEDAKRILDFALALAEFLFVLPSRVKRGISDAKGSGSSKLKD